MSYALQQGLSVSVEKQGPGPLKKAGFPLRRWKFSEIRTPAYEFLFNLSGEIKVIRGLTPAWPHPAEHLKRTDGNDWVYYSVGDDSSADGIISWMGEYYLPCLPYPSNPVWDLNYLANPAVMTAFGAWSQLYADLWMAPRKSMHPRVRTLVDTVLKHHDQALHERSQQLNAIIGGRVSVLPPDTRHVDYEVVPLVIADGCLYHCGFCCVKSARAFRARGMDDIRAQILALKAFYGRNLENYHALFLGNHDALAAGADTILGAAVEACRVLGFAEPGAGTPALYLFGSVGSLLGSEDALFEALDRLPFRTCVNIGFESVDPSTLALIHKPVDASMVRAAFGKMLAVNAACANIEISGNFLLGMDLPPRHETSLAELLGDAPPGPRGKGAVYLSPLRESPRKRELLPKFIEIKKASHLPVFIYLIQRL